MDGHFHVSEVKIRGSGGYFQRRPITDAPGVTKGQASCRFSSGYCSHWSPICHSKNQSIMRVEYRVAIRKKIDYLRNEQYNEPIWRVEYEAEVREWRSFWGLLRCFGHSKYDDDWHLKPHNGWEVPVGTEKESAKSSSCEMQFLKSNFVGHLPDWVAWFRL